MLLAKHNDDQTEEHICHNHDNVLILEAAYTSQLDPRYDHKNCIIGR